MAHNRQIAQLVIAKIASSSEFGSPEEIQLEKEPGEQPSFTFPYGSTPVVNLRIDPKRHVNPRSKSRDKISITSLSMTLDRRRSRSTPSDLVYDMALRLPHAHPRPESEPDHSLRIKKRSDPIPIDPILLEHDRRVASETGDEKTRTTSPELPPHRFNFPPDYKHGERSYRYDRLPKDLFPNSLNPLAGEPSSDATISPMTPTFGRPHAVQQRSSPSRQIQCEMSYAKYGAAASKSKNHVVSYPPVHQGTGSPYSCSLQPEPRISSKESENLPSYRQVGGKSSSSEHELVGDYAGKLMYRVPVVYRSSTNLRVSITAARTVDKTKRGSKVHAPRHYPAITAQQHGYQTSFVGYKNHKISSEQLSRTLEQANALPILWQTRAKSNSVLLSKETTGLLQTARRAKRKTEFIRSSPKKQEWILGLDWTSKETLRESEEALRAIILAGKEHEVDVMYPLLNNRSNPLTGSSLGVRVEGKKEMQDSLTEQLSSKLSRRKNISSLDQIICNQEENAVYNLELSTEDIDEMFD